MAEASTPHTSQAPGTPSVPPRSNGTPTVRRTSPRVHLWDRVAGMVISVGGVFVIIAVLGICLFLGASVVPLFRSGDLRDVGSVTVAMPVAPVALVPDEYQQIVLLIGKQGMVVSSHISSGTVLSRQQLGAAGASVSALSFDAASGLIAVGRSDGTVQLGAARFVTTLQDQTQVSAAAKSLIIGKSIPEGAEVIERIGFDQFRRVGLKIELRDPVSLKHGEGAVKRIDYRMRGENEFLLCVREHGDASLSQVRTIRPMGGGKPRVKLTAYPIPFQQRPDMGLPGWAYVTGDGTSIFMLWNDGSFQRYSCRNPDSTPIALAEAPALLAGGRKVQCAEMALGGQTLLMGDEQGTLHAAFAAVQPAAFTPDGLQMAIAHVLRLSSAPITSIGIGSRDRTVAIGDASGGVQLVNVTSEKQVASVKIGSAGPVMAATLTPKFDGLIALSGNGNVQRWNLEAGHPEASFTSLFGRVHYEGAPAPAYVYQSTSGEDSAEPKLSLVPLMLGTLKATVFAMMFAAPLGILAAIYTSEFVKPNVRKVLKPSIEMMASLPSVVLGFIAALVVAPWVAQHLSSMLLALFVVPLGVMLGGYLWQLISPSVERRIPLLAKFCCVTIFAIMGVGVAALFAPKVESALFGPTQRDLYVLGGSYVPADKELVPVWVGGRTQMEPNDERRLRNEAGMYFRDGIPVVARATRTEAERLALAQNLAMSELAKPSLRTWLDGNVGAIWPGWFMILFPVGSVVTAMIDRYLRGRGIYSRIDALPRSQGSLWYLGKFAASVTASGVVALAMALLVSALGIDSRDVMFGSFSQRNTLVVGIMMGFAIIPIIYTISEDAMRSVPPQLRTASLGAGATPWQTALRIVVPVAGSGIFSAIMIGLGRATGETMIVVMATGNSASMDWNMFSGFRTLSANIAVELPEAVQDSTHYRVLFLCGLVLFVMTFILNTTAEVVRQRVRRRNAAL